MEGNEENPTEPSLISEMRNLMKKRRERSKAKGKREYIGRPAPGVTVLFVPSDIRPEIMDSIKAAGRSVKGAAVGLKDGVLGMGKGIAKGYQRASAAPESDASLT